MAVKGRLDGIGFAGILQLLARSGKSGKLTLTQYAGQGLVVLRRGRIIYAASSAARETLGNVLLCRGLIDERQLEQSLVMQHKADEERRLGAILVERGLISRQDLESIVSEQVEKTVAEFMAWDSGFFRFQEMELPDRGEVELDATDFLLEEGLPADHLLLGVARQLQERQDEGSAADTDTDRDGGEDDAEAAGEGPPPVDAAPASGAAPQQTLRSVMGELPAPAFHGEETLEILTHAQRLVHRGVLFSTGRLGFSGMGQFGIEPPPGVRPDFVRRIRLPIGEPSILTEAIARKAAYRGALPRTRINEQLVATLGGGWPPEVLVAPLLVSGRVLLVLYGDNLPDGEPIESPGELEWVLYRTGLTMEKAMLERRAEHLERLRGQ